MPTTIEIVGADATQESLNEVFDYFTKVDERFSTYKPTSEISLWNAGKIMEEDLSEEMKTVLKLAEKTKKETNGFFDINFDGMRDPSGLVKGFAIHNGAEILRATGFENFYVEIGGDIEVAGKNKYSEKWSIGIQNPFKKDEIVKVVYLSNCGIATSGTSARGLHVYNPKTGHPANEIASISVIGPNVYEADRFATATFAMGADGIHFIENLPGFEGYMVDLNGVATMTQGFKKYTYA